MLMLLVLIITTTALINAIHQLCIKLKYTIVSKVTSHAKDGEEGEKEAEE
jgi:hypothetical protein